MLSLPLLLTLAALVATVLSRLEVSPWFVLLAASVAGTLEIVTWSHASSCVPWSSTTVVFDYAAMFAIGLFATAAFTSLFDAVSMARRGLSELAARRLVPLVLGLGMGFATFALLVAAVLHCVS